MTHSKRIARAEHAVKNEMDAFTAEDIKDMRGYVAETIVWRLIRDGFIPDGVEGES